MIQSRELAYVPSRPVGERLLVIEFERPTETVSLLFQVLHSVGHWFGRMLRGERSHAGRGVVTFYSSSVHIVRDPVRKLDERRYQLHELAYDDITRLEFVAPTTVIVGFGLVMRGLNQQVVLTLSPLAAQDKFDSIVELFEERASGHLYSILDNGNLTHSQTWTWEERFPDMGLTDEVTIALVDAGTTWRWKIVTGEGEEFDVVESHGLVLTASVDPQRGLMQGFSSQLVDGTGFALSLVERDGPNFGFSSSRDERFWIDADGDVRLGEEIVGTFPIEGDPTGGIDAVSAYMGSAPKIEWNPHAPRVLSLTRPLPKAWVLALALVTLLPRHAATTDSRA